LRGPQFSWVPIFLTAFSLRHATIARRVIFLPETVDLLLDSQLARILPFGFRRRPAARFRSLRRFLSPPTGNSGFFLRDPLMLRYGLHRSPIRLSLRRFLGGRCLASARVACTTLHVTIYCAYKSDVDEILTF
jgi:hypothetical protein